MPLSSNKLQNPVPSHVGIIMDGNGRWAKNQGKPRLFGHNRGVEIISNIIQAAIELKIKYLTLFSFSTENWQRPTEEINGLFELIETFIDAKQNDFLKEEIRFTIIGDLSAFPNHIIQKLSNLVHDSQNHLKMTVCIALNYGGKHDIVQAAQSFAREISQGKLAIEDLTEARFAQYLYTNTMPEPELIIRTSGEQRISNFLLWQIAYSELYFSDTLWPDFTRECFFQAITAYQTRNRRIGNI